MKETADFLLGFESFRGDDTPLNTLFRLQARLIKSLASVLRPLATNHRTKTKFRINFFVK